jgi:uncharacterized protein YndB with AHSA1/START domain
MVQASFAVQPGKQEVVITRIFDAPRALVFKVDTDPKLIPQWWGPKIYQTTVDKMEVKPGGMWRFIQQDAKGNKYGFHGVYHAVEPPDKLIYTFEFEGMPDHVSMETVTFEEQNGKTIMTDRVLYQSVEDRDAVVNTGMEKGSSESMERFAELLAKLQK